MLYQIRPSEVAGWAAWELDLMDDFLAREPSHLDRIEMGLARLSMQWAGQDKPDIAKYLPYLNAWDEVPDPAEPDDDNDELTQADQSVMNYFNDIQ